MACGSIFGAWVRLCGDADDFDAPEEDHDHDDDRDRSVRRGAIAEFISVVLLFGCRPLLRVFGLLTRFVDCLVLPLLR